MDEAQQGLSELGGWASRFNFTTNRVAIYFTVAMLALGLIGVVWALVSKNERAKTYLIAWIVALVFTVLFIAS